MNDLEPPSPDPSAPVGESSVRFADHGDVLSARGYSLASLFLLVTATAVLAGLARNIFQTGIQPIVISIHAGVGSFLGFLAGAVIGFGYPRRLRGMLLGSFVGWLTGGVCAALAAAGGSPWLFVLGAAALVALGFASRWVRRRG